MNRGVKAQLLRATSITQNAREGTFCKYSHRNCMQNCIEGFEYCIRHILEDKTAPFRQCAFSTKAGRRCPSAAPKLEKKEGFCAYHTKRALVARQRVARKRRPKELPDGLLEELVVTTSAMDGHPGTEPRRGKVHSESIASRALDYASSSDSEAEPLLVEHAWRDSGDSDAESVDSDQEDVLKYAGIYTTEEVAQILRDKLIRLQALYIDQFKRLKHVLLSKRRKYLQSQKVEKELYGSIKRYKDNPLLREKYDKLCAMKRYHKKFGKEALMQRQATQRRMKISEGMSNKMPISVTCSFVDDGLKCGQTVVPLSKYCQKHILHDQSQVLYRPCPFADSQCGRPVPTLLGNPFCSLHQSLPPSLSVENAALEKVKLELDEEPGEKNMSGNQPEMKADLRKVKKEKLEDFTGQESGRSELFAGEETAIKMETNDDEAEAGGKDVQNQLLLDITVNKRDTMDDDEDDDDAHGLR